MTRLFRNRARGGRIDGCPLVADPGQKDLLVAENSSVTNDINSSWFWKSSSDIWLYVQL